MVSAVATEWDAPKYMFGDFYVIATLFVMQLSYKQQVNDLHTKNIHKMIKRDLKKKQKLQKTTTKNVLTTGLSWITMRVEFIAKHSM